jgi:hypothetical protein
MKGKGLVVILIMCLGLLVAITLLIAADEQRMALSSEQGFKVRIAPSGKIVNAVNWDGKPVQYADENRDITKARLAFFEEEGKGEPTHYFKKVDGKWQKTVWGAEVTQGEPDDIAQGITVHVNPDGTILSVTNNIDGLQVKIDFKNVRIATKNACCYGYCIPGILCCLCRFCPGGRC